MFHALPALGPEPCLVDRHDNRWAKLDHAVISFDDFKVDLTSIESQTTSQVGGKCHHTAFSYLDHTAESLRHRQQHICNAEMRLGSYQPPPDCHETRDAGLIIQLMVGGLHHPLQAPADARRRIEQGADWTVMESDHDFIGGLVEETL